MSDLVKMIEDARRARLRWLAMPASSSEEDREKARLEYADLRLRALGAVALEIDR